MIVSHLTQVTPAPFLIEFHGEVTSPVEVTSVQRVRLVQQEQIIGQLFGRCEIVDVDERMRRGEFRVIHSTFDHLQKIRLNLHNIFGFN